jgi:hypothetical protein
MELTWIILLNNQSDSYATEFTLDVPHQGIAGDVHLTHTYTCATSITEATITVVHGAFFFPETFIKYMGPPT